MNASKRTTSSPMLARHFSTNAGSQCASDSPAMTAFGTFLRTILAVRTLKRAMSSSVLRTLPMSGSFHISHVSTRAAKWRVRASTQRSHAASASSPVGKPPARSNPPPPG